MQILRIIVVTIIAGWLCWFLGKTIVHGLRTGAIRHTDSTSTCRRDKNPIGFWCLVVFFSAIVIGFATEWVFIVADAVRKMK